MRIDGNVKCLDFTCLDTRRSSYFVPDVDIEPSRVSAVLISEAAPHPCRLHLQDPQRRVLFTREACFAILCAGGSGFFYGEVQTQDDRGGH